MARDEASAPGPRAPGPRSAVRRPVGPRAWRIPGAALAPWAAEGAVAARLWEVGAAAVWIDGPDLVGYFAAPPPEPPGPGGWDPVDTTDHVAAYLSTLAPIEVGPLVVAPTHREVRLRSGQQVVWLDPGMAFGTGHHETTRLALEALGRVPLVGRRVLDVGAGSGLLAIAADKLGAADAWGLDIDPDTVPIAHANAHLNRSRARFLAGGFGQLPVDPLVDVVVANLYAELHVGFLAEYQAVTAPGADVLLTGILDPRDGGVRRALPARLRLLDERRDGDWWLLHLRKEG